MKTKKLNRGLALGAAMLVGLAGFVTFDYFNFKSNKDEIKAAVENYLNDCAAASVSQNGSSKAAIEKVIEDNWGYNEFYEKNFLFSYVTASSINDDISTLGDEAFSKGHLDECSVKLGDVKVSKAGPNLAQATVTYTMDFKGKGQAQLLTLNGVSNTIYSSMNFQTSEIDYDTENNAFDGLEYSGHISYEEDATFYLEYEGGKWKIVAANGYANDFFIYDENNENIDLDKAAKGGSGEAGGNKNEDDNKPDENSSKKLQIKLPDGTIIDIPENAEIIGGDIAGIDPDNAEKMPEAAAPGDDTSIPEPKLSEPEAGSADDTTSEGGADNG